MLAKIGPLWNAKIFRPDASSASRLVPVMSAGIRSGVNWMREKVRPRISPRLRTISVLPNPGTPSSRQWPPHTSAMKTCSINASWPTIARAISAFSSANVRRARSMRCSMSSTDSVTRIVRHFAFSSERK